MAHTPIDYEEESTIPSDKGIRRDDSRQPLLNVREIAHDQENSDVEITETNRMLIKNQNLQPLLPGGLSYIARGILQPARSILIADPTLDQPEIENIKYNRLISARTRPQSTGPRRVFQTEIFNQSPLVPEHGATVSKDTPLNVTFFGDVLVEIDSFNRNDVLITPVVLLRVQDLTNFRERIVSHPQNIVFNDNAQKSIFPIELSGFNYFDIFTKDFDGTRGLGISIAIVFFDITDVSQNWHEIIAEFNKGAETVNRRTGNSFNTGFDNAMSTITAEQPVANHGLSLDFINTEFIIYQNNRSVAGASPEIPTIATITTTAHTYTEITNENSRDNEQLEGTLNIPTFDPLSVTAGTKTDFTIDLPVSERFTGFVFESRDENDAVIQRFNVSSLGNFRTVLSLGTDIRVNIDGTISGNTLTTKTVMRELPTNLSVPAGRKIVVKAQLI